MSEVAQDPISLSFIDCISCGLAAALFMFLVFSAIPRSAALVETQLQGSAGAPESQIPSLFAGTGGDVPIDVRIVFETGLVTGERSGSWTPAGSQATTTIYVANDGTTTAFLGSFRSGDALLPSFQLKSLVDSPAIAGTISIRAGSDVSVIPFLCPASMGGAQQDVIAFDAAELRSDCGL